MNIADHHLSAIGRLGYTRRESEFLYIVATFSGYFVPRQFVSFVGVKWGKCSASFTATLERRGHAAWREHLNVGGVYQLFSKTLYRLTDRENLRNQRRHSVEFVRTRLLLLDFVLANQTYDYLETDEDKVCYFHREMGIPITMLPAKAYACRAGGESTVRYFVDKFPLFFETPEDRTAHRVTVSYVDAGEAARAGFSHHINLYVPLLRRLPEVNFIYISNSNVHFASAEKRFRFCLLRAFRTSNSADILRYFKLRSAWDRKQYGSLTTEDIEWLEKADAQLRSPEIEGLFGSWAAGAVSDDDLIRPERTPRGMPDVRFSSCLVRPATVLAQDSLNRGQA
jgi:hypothetical protein